MLTRAAPRMRAEDAGERRQQRIRVGLAAGAQPACARRAAAGLRRHPAAAGRQARARRMGGRAADRVRGARRGRRRGRRRGLRPAPCRHGRAASRGARRACARPSDRRSSSARQARGRHAAEHVRIGQRRGACAPGRRGRRRRARAGQRGARGAAGGRGPGGGRGRGGRLGEARPAVGGRLAAGVAAVVRRRCARAGAARRAVCARAWVQAGPQPPPRSRMHEALPHVCHCMCRLHAGSTYWATSRMLYVRCWDSALCSHNHLGLPPASEACPSYYPLLQLPPASCRRAAAPRRPGSVRACWRRSSRRAA